MSRTRKTRPLHVRMADPKDHGVGYVEVHNHADGRECDLPEHPLAKDMEDKVTSPMGSIIQPHRPCHYSFSFNGHGLCGCRMCTGHDEHIRGNRKSRHDAKHDLHEVLKTHEYDSEDLDEEFGTH